MWPIPRRKVLLHSGISKSIFRFIKENKLVEGSYIEDFEKNFAVYIGASDAIAVSSGTAALSLILSSLPLNKNDEVILPAYTFPSIPKCAKALGLSLNFVDINLDTLNLDIEKLKEAVNNNTKVIIVTHLFGIPFDIDSIRQIAKEKKIFIIEDCAHAVGSEYKGRKTGGLADASFFSFSLTKPFNTLNGGMVVSNNRELMIKIRQKLKAVPNFPKGFLFRNIFIAYLLYFLTWPPIFAFSIYPILIVLSIFKKNILNFYDKVFKKLIFFDLKIYKLSNFQAFIGMQCLPYHKQEILQRLNKLKLFQMFFKTENVNIINQKHLLGKDNVFYYFFILKHHNVGMLSRKLLWRGIDTGSGLMKNCGTLFNESRKYPNTEEICRSSLQLPLEHCNENNMKAIAKVLKEYI